MDSEQYKNTTTFSVYAFVQSTNVLLNYHVLALPYLVYLRLELTNLFRDFRDGSANCLLFYFALLAR